MSIISIFLFTKKNCGMMTDLEEDNEKTDASDQSQKDFESEIGSRNVPQPQWRIRHLKDADNLKDKSPAGN